MHYYSNYPKPRGKGSYFLPFVSLIIAGLIVVLVFEIVDYFQDKHAQALQNKAALTVVSGKTDMKIWGLDQWAAAVSGTILNSGDSIRTDPGSRAVLSFQNGSLLRLDAESEIELIDLKSRDGHDEADIKINRGNVWFKSSTADTVQSSFLARTSHLEVSGTRITMALTQGPRESVRVLEGKALVTVKVESGEDEKAALRAADTLEVAFGQEVTIGADELLSLKSRRPVELLAMLADEFHGAEWYSWNRGEDRTGGSVVSVENAVELGTQTPPAPGLEPAENEPVPVAVKEFPSPKVTNPAQSPLRTTQNTVTISGTTDAKTSRMEVVNTHGTVRDSYTLQKYKAGTTTWSYVVSPPYGNLYAGENRYEIFAFDKQGTKSLATTLSIIYEKPSEPADLSAPKVTSFNGQASESLNFETTSNEIIVLGTIGKGITKIFINDFALSRYVPSSGKWSYFAKPVYGNLKEGENTYTVYGVDFEGNKTPMTKFTILKKAAVVAPPLPSPAPAEQPQASPPPSSDVPL